MNALPTLFGKWQGMQEWRRIGRPGMLRTVTFPSQNKAEKAQQRSVSRKLRRGYIPVNRARECRPHAVD